MKRALRSSEASRDVEEIVGYYSKYGLPAANRFIDECEDRIRKIESMPNIGSPRFAIELDVPGLRLHPLKDFPHVIFYIERVAHIDIVRVMHASRDIFNVLLGMK